MGKTSGFVLKKEKGYFENRGVNIMAFDDIYPEGHQSGVSVLMHGHRIATNGDIRFEQCPGQWQPVPKQLERKMDPEEGIIQTKLAYPDMDRHMKGFNPMIYPDFEFEYEVTVKAVGEQISVSVDLSKPVPEEFLGKLCFNMELFPGILFDKGWIMDDQHGVFPRQPNGPLFEQKKNLDHSGKLPSDITLDDMKLFTANGESYSPIVADDLLACPYATGTCFTVCPEVDENRFSVTSLSGQISLYDGRMNHNNGWFVISEPVQKEKTKGAIEWMITPNVIKDWCYTPVVQISQVGYHPDQQKTAVIELDQNDTRRMDAYLVKYTAKGEEKVCDLMIKEWGDFLRYHYLQVDFTPVTEEGLYKVCYGDCASSMFKIAKNVYDRGVWQPVLEYFLPVQMCHMRVAEKYKVWHDLCHDDDAKMAQLNYNSFDGYIQGPDTLCDYKPGECVPGLNQGGWHDAGDFDLRIESQAGECYILACAYEEFNVQYDATTIDEEKKITEIHQPDGKNDIQQQIVHGLLSVVGAYKALGRLYRGIICPTLRQYVLLGDSSAMTKNIVGDEDDRWVFTEDNPVRELMTAGWLAGSARAITGFDDMLAKDTLKAAEEIYAVTRMEEASKGAKIFAAVELFLTTKKEIYRQHILSEADYIADHIEKLGYIAAKCVKALDDEAFYQKLYSVMEKANAHFTKESEETPYGIPYRPHIWGAGWAVQSWGYQYYYLLKAFPEIFDKTLLQNALNFVLGCHPGSNTASFASGVGTKSATVAYGLNRSDWTYIPGGVISGTALIRPDFPELLEFPFLWQQTEYVLGGGSSNYMFLVLAVKHLFQ